MVVHGTGSSPRLMRTLLASSGVFQMMPLSMTVISVSGLPVVTSHAWFVPGPLTPNSSWGLLAVTGS